MSKLDAAMKEINKHFGAGSVMRLDGSAVQNVPVIPTGSLALDQALGIGGVPRGRIIEVYGPESSGKTTLTLHMIAEAQKAGGKAAFIDAEHALDPGYARDLGVDIDSMILSQPSSGEEALEITDTLVRSGELAILVVDSVAALTPRAELEGEMGDAHVGRQARLMSQAMRKLVKNNEGHQHDLGVHQPDSVQNRGGLWKPRDYDRRQRLEVLLIRPHRHPSQRESEG